MLNGVTDSRDMLSVITQFHANKEEKQTHHVHLVIIAQLGLSLGLVSVLICSINDSYHTSKAQTIKMVWRTFHVDPYQRH